MKGWIKEKQNRIREFFELHGKWKRRMVIVCAVQAVICFLAAGGFVLWQYRQEARSEEKVERLRQMGAEPLRQENAESEEPQTVKENPQEGEGTQMQGTQMQEAQMQGTQPNPYEELFALNEDMAAWLKIEGTKIDYPVMQTMEDENYYLKRDFYGNADEAGCLLLDTDSSLYGEISANQIIHGHNMKSGTMFGELDLYRDEAYAREHSRIRLFTRDMERNYEVISVFYSQVYYSTDLVFKYYQFFRADTEEQFQYFYDNIKELSLFDTGVEAEFGDRFLTLSTCSYQVKDGRFVVVAKEVEPGPAYAEPAD